MPRLDPIEAADGGDDMGDVVVVEKRVHRQQQAALEEAVGARQLLGEAEKSHLVQGHAAPLDDGADPVCGEVRLELVTPSALDLVVLKAVEAIRLAVRRRRQAQILDFRQALVVAVRDGAPALQVGAEVVELGVQDRGLELSSRQLVPQISTTRSSPVP
jgi:hypothetical protein